jgi:L-amino acid N-acyltransferase YncA
MLNVEQFRAPIRSAIREASIADLPSIGEIYNQAIEHTVGTFACRPRTHQEMSDWYFAHDSRHPVYVLTRGSEVVGWGSLSTWSLREGYRDTVEISVYLAPSARGYGQGGRMFDHLVEAAKRIGHHCIICCHTVGNTSMEPRQNPAFALFCED